MAKNKPETFSIRLDPQTRYLAELAARSQGRSLANFIQMAVEQVLETEDIETYGNRGKPVKVRSPEFVKKVWDLSEPERLVRLALAYPELLSFEEQALYKRLRREYLKTGAQEPYEFDSFDWDGLLNGWAEFKRKVQSHPIQAE